MTERDEHDTTDKAPRPSQAEGEAESSDDRPSGAQPEEGDAPRPSQAEGDLETVEEALREQEDAGQ